jgi:hypothetical protein
MEQNFLVRAFRVLKSALVPQSVLELATNVRPTVVRGSSKDKILWLSAYTDNVAGQDLFGFKRGSSRGSLVRDLPAWTWNAPVHLDFLPAY